MSRPKRKPRISYSKQRAIQHIEERKALSSLFGGIDCDIENIFLSLPSEKLDVVFSHYGETHGANALSYAKDTYPKWKSGSTKMSGMVAERLLNLIPAILDTATRFDLVKKLRYVHMLKVSRHVTCEPNDWRDKVAPVVAELLTASNTFQLPQNAIARVHWLADGDAAAAQRLLAAAEQEEAAVRLRFLETEFKRIDFLLQNIKASKTVSHTIELPQGTISISIITPKKAFWSRLGDLLS